MKRLGTNGEHPDEEPDPELQPLCVHSVCTSVKHLTAASTHAGFTVTGVQGAQETVEEGKHLPCMLSL